MGLKALAHQVVERNAACTEARNRAENRATMGATEPPSRPTVFDLAERTAIIQEGAPFPIPVEWAEGFARLSTAPCPPGIAEAAWQGMIDAAGRFLDQWGAPAATLGWTAAELFGLDPQAPERRLDRRGAAFFLVDAEVLVVTADLITIRKRGSVLKIPRRAALTAPAWQAC